ncbi:amino acid permease [Mycolicibacterium litorale]|uniref:amino acid permease n=1 Tax=Mycolicibacterium litorale TaxID=758802 RepID=UPI001624D24A|nr:amino acid permease [Mycolicibacterium litorale]
MARRLRSVEQAIADTDEPGSRLRRDLTWWDLTVFGVSVVIGVGIFTITASTAGNITGPAIAVSFLIAATACGLAAMCYAEFASTVPVAGSAYTFSYIVFGELVAWIIGWDLILEVAVAAAVIADSWSGYLGTMLGLGRLTTHLGALQIDWGALSIIAAVTAILASGAKVSARVSLAITAVKVSVVLLVIIVGAFYINTANYFPFIPPAEPAGGETEQSLLSLVVGGGSSHYGWYGLLAGASIVFFAFIGFDIVATAAEETRRPQRDVPRGILASLVIVTVLYIAVVIVLTGMVKYTTLHAAGDNANLATAFAVNGVNWAAHIVALGALAGLTTVQIVVLFGQTRLVLAMSRDGLMPRWLSRTGRRRTPIRITVLGGMVVAVAASLFPIGMLDEMVNIGSLFAFTLVSGGVILLRRRRPDLPRGFRVPFMPLIPICSVTACVWLMLNLTALTWIRFVAWLGTGLIIYALYGRRRSALAHRIRQGGIESVRRADGEVS